MERRLVPGSWSPSVSKKDFKSGLQALAEQLQPRIGAGCFAD